MLKQKIKENHLDDDIKKCYNKMFPEFHLKPKKKCKDDIFIINKNIVKKKKKKKKKKKFNYKKKIIN